jgi:hypothetical protein
MRIPAPQKRIDSFWIAAALVVGVGGVAGTTASSSAHVDTGMATGGLQLAAVGDPALTSSDPTDSAAESRLVYATGVAASDPSAAPQTWVVGDRTVLGYTASGGRFCFEFRALGGGCLEPGVLTDAHPIELTTDYGRGVFHVYGLVLDGVTAVSVAVGGTARPAALAHNAFSFSDDELGGTDGITAEVVATMRDGTTREAPFHVDPLANAVAAP